MRHISENQPPEALIVLRAVRRISGLPLDYDDVGQVEVAGQKVTVTTEIRRKRLEDQGHLCAYTMMRIDMGSSHNEHLVPRTVSRAEGRVEETLAYANIVACYPGEEQKGGCPFGAKARRDLPLVLKPTDPGCEGRLRYDRVSGRVEPAQASDAELLEQLNKILHLNHETLVARRKTAYEKAGVGEGCREPISATQARLLAREVVRNRQGGELTPYCVAIAQVALVHAEVLEKRRSILAARRASAGGA
jgi:uncharacterized protein (TIGR02646 family)